VRRIQKDYVGPDTPGTVILGGSPVGRPGGLDAETKAALQAQYEAEIQRFGRPLWVPAAERFVVEVADNMGLKVSLRTAGRNVVDVVHKRLRKKGRK
jgi:hypothetical protein